MTLGSDIETFNPKAGISIGISIAIALILLTVVMLFIIKRFWVRREDVYVGIPSEQEEQLLRSTTDSDTFLYLQKLKEIREQDSNTFGGSTDSSEHNRSELPNA